MFYNEIIPELQDSAKNNKRGYPFSACIYHNGYYHFSVNTVIEDCDPTAHAEVNAIRELCDILNTTDLTGAVMIASGEPCPLCLTAIAWTGIKEVYFIDRYNVANEKGYYFDRDSFKTNEQLNLGLNIQCLS